MKNDESSEYRKYLDNIIRLYNEILDNIQDRRQLLFDYESARGALHAISVDAVYRQGFKDGLRAQSLVIKPIRRQSGKQAVEERPLFNAGGVSGE